MNYFNSRIACGLVLLAGLVNGCTTSAQNSSADRSLTMQNWTVYVGTYTGGKSKGIYQFQLDLATGALTPSGVAVETSSPSFLVIHPNGKFVYAVSEGGKAGGVSSFARDLDGKLTLLNRQPSHGASPCHLSLDREGKHLFVANYSSGSAAVFPIQPDGSLAAASAVVQHQGTGPNPQRQEGPHAHSIYLDADNHFAFVADLGLDKIMVYRFDAKAGTLTPNDPPFAAVAPGAGPRHLAFSPNGKFAYVINEMGSSVTAFSYDAKLGALKELQALSTLPADFHGNSSCAEIQVHPSGKFLYGSNRGHDSIAIFAIDPTTGKLTALGHQSTLGKVPRNFALDPSGKYLLAANQDSDTITVFRIDPKTGMLTAVGQPVEAPKPVCIEFTAGAK